jgi:ribonuclease HI
MPESAVLTIHTDGAARGNPGPAAFAYVIARDGQPPVEEAGRIGSTTNNQAEYTALVRALEHAARLATPHDRVVVHSDSELMVKQMRGEYRVKDEGLKPLYERARRLSSAFAHPPKFVHVRRAQNARTDELCNLALDGLWRPQAPPHPPTPSPTQGRGGERQPDINPATPSSSLPPLPSVGEGGRGGEGNPTIHDRAVALLGGAAAAWARGDASNPAPAEVWRQLWQMVAEQDAADSDPGP